MALQSTADFIPIELQTAGVFWSDQAYGLHGEDDDDGDGDGDGSEHFALPMPRLPAVDPFRSTFRSRGGRPDGGAYGYNNGHGGFDEGALGPVMGLAAPATAAIMKLEKVKYGEAGAGEGTSADSTACAICIQDYEAGDELSVVPCSGRHRFHTGCLAVWVARKLSCPLCRHALSR